MPKASLVEKLDAQRRHTDRTCPNCAKGQPLYRVKVKKGTMVKINGSMMKIDVDTEIFECVRCRTQLLR